MKDRFPSIWGFDYLVLLPSDSTSRTRVAFVRAGSVIAFEDFDTASLIDSLPVEVSRVFSEPLRPVQHDWQYDEFCLVANYLVHPLKSVELVKLEAAPTLQATSRNGVTGRPNLPSLRHRSDKHQAGSVFEKDVKHEGRRSASSPPQQAKEGWPRHQEKLREASFDGADGVVWSRDSWTTPPRLRELMWLRSFLGIARPNPVALLLLRRGADAALSKALPYFGQQTPRYLRPFSLCNAIFRLSVFRWTPRTSAALL